MTSRSLLAALARYVRELVRRALANDWVIVIGLLVGTIVVNGIIALLIIGWLQSMGLWDVPLGRLPRSDLPTD
jgi:hypothetical protein